jgi:hypothetical protein
VIATGADEIVERDVERLGERREALGVLVDERSVDWPAASAASTFFNEWSSVPPRKRTASPDARRARATGSASTSSSA